MTKEEAKVINSTYKLILNSTYGLMGSKYSKLYSPHALLQVTLTGQLTMLMAIEQLNEIDGVVVYASNTDSIVYKAKKGKPFKKAQKVIEDLEKITGLVFENEYPEKQYMRDINSYVAVYDGYTKAKGFYGEPDLSKNNEYPIVTEAIRKFLLDGTPMKQTIKKCDDPAQFCVSRRVTGGALWSHEEYPNTEEYEEYINKVPFKKNKALEKRNDEYKKQFVLIEADKWYIGKVVRYYYATDGKPMFYKGSGNRVPKSDGCRPMMKLKKKIPKDLDYEKYIDLAHTHLKELGYE